MLKREGDEPEDNVPRKKSRKKNKKKSHLTLGGDADDEGDETERPKGVRKTIQKPVSPSKIGIHKLREEFVNANNKNIISKDEYNRFNELYQSFIKAKGKQASKSKIINDAREVYKAVLFKKLKDGYKNQ